MAKKAKKGESMQEVSSSQMGGIRQLKVSDLALFHQVYNNLKDGQNISTISHNLGVPRKYLYAVIGKIEEQINLPGGGKGFLTKAAKDTSSHGEACDRFHVELGAILGDLDDVFRVFRYNHKNKVTILASEWTISWFLPRLLEKSGFLKENPDIVLDIQRAYSRNIIAKIENNGADLAISLKPSHDDRIGEKISTRPLFPVNRSLIYPANHEFACEKRPPGLRLSDLSRETIFVLSNEPTRGFSMADRLPTPDGEGRRILIESTSHMYMYVMLGLGVAIGYEKGFAPFHDGSLVETQELHPDDRSVAEYHLYWPTDRKPSTAAGKLKDAILKYTHEVNNSDKNYSI